MYLADVADDLSRQLEERGRLSWFEEECAKLETQAYYNSLIRVPTDLFPRVKKVKALSPAERVNAFRLVSWREEEAAAQDKPPYFLLKDQALTEVAKLKPQSAQELAEQASRVIHPNFARFNGNAICHLLNQPPTEEELEQAEALLSGPSAPVDASKKEIARANAIFSLLHAYFLNVCAAADMEPNFVISQQELKHFATEAITGRLDDVPADGFGEDADLPKHREILRKGSWRWELVGEGMLAFLQGKVSVSYDPSTELPKFTNTDEWTQV